MFLNQERHHLLILNEMLCSSPALLKTPTILYNTCAFKVFLRPSSADSAIPTRIHILFHVCHLEVVKMDVFSHRDLDEGDGRGKVVCVMDASSYVGFSIVQGLLHKGYTVHASVPNGVEVESLMELSGERLKILYADMLDYHSIVDALTGCSGLFYIFEPPQYDEVMAEVEVRAAHNVLEACAHTETIEKVVFTSSVAAVVWRDDRNSIAELHERHWSDINLCRKLKLWYALGKTLSERTAWALAMDRGVNMVAINAGLVVGPGSEYKTSGSTISYLKGAAQMYENGMLASADVRFVADAHICTFEDHSAYGRYICFNQIVNNAKNADNLAENLKPLISFPDRCEDSSVYQQRLSNKKLSELMLGNTKQ